MKPQSPFRLPTFIIIACLLLNLLPDGSAQGEAESRFAIPATDDGLPGEGPIRRYEWFQNLWQNRREAWAQTVEQDRGSIVFLGDSITQGWGGGLGAAFPGMKVANRGISGDTTRGVLIRLKEDVLSLDPAGVVILIGTNDLEEGATPETIAGNLGLILQALRTHDAALPIVVCEVFPSSQEKKRPSEMIQRINQLYLELVKGDEKIHYLDTFDLFDDGKGDAIPAEFPDLLHPNEAGYAKWAAALRPVLQTFGLLDYEDDFQLEEGFEYLYNGRDLSGWGFRVTSQKDREGARKWRESDPKGAAAWPFVDEPIDFEGKRSSPDGRFVAMGDRLLVAQPEEYRRIQQINTIREFGQDFVLRLEFRATPNTDSGIYIRGPQLQCRDYSLAGPYKDLKSYKPQGWNQIEIRVTGNRAVCTCNGEVLESDFRVPDSGPIGLEGDRGQMEYRRIRIKLL